MSCHRSFDNNNTADTAIGAGTVYPFGAYEFTPGVHVANS